MLAPLISRKKRINRGGISMCLMELAGVIWASLWLVRRSESASCHAATGPWSMGLCVGCTLGLGFLRLAVSILGIKRLRSHLAPAQRTTLKVNRFRPGWPDERARVRDWHIVAAIGAVVFRSCVGVFKVNGRDRPRQLQGPVCLQVL